MNRGKGQSVRVAVGESFVMYIAEAKMYRACGRKKRISKGS